MKSKAPMNIVSGDSQDGIWEGEIPGQDPGTIIYWSLHGEDNNGYTYYTYTKSYFIFEPIEGNALIFNNGYRLYGNLLYSSWLGFYWQGTDFDLWDASFGNITSELLEYYDILIEISHGFSHYNSNDVINNWWNGTKTYVVAGDEWFGIRYGWENDVIIPEGDVARTILGIDTYYPDINYSTSGDQEGISRLIPDSAGAASILADFLSDSLLLNYDPQYETGHSNWLDGFDIVDGYTVDMTAYSGVLDSNGNVAEDAEIYNVMTHGQQGNGGKSAFMSFDPIALNTTPGYHWVGASSYWHTFVAPICPPNASPLISVYEALQGIVSVDDEAEIPKSFSLKDNYPNPFNPVTNIHYELHQNTNVKITIYDLLGRKVKHLVNAHQTAGEKTVQWNGTNDLGQPVSAGVYFYKVETPEKQITKKMAVLK